MLVVCVVVVLVLIGWVTAWQGSWLASGARARAVADLVALAAAQAQQSAHPACEVAERTSAQNAARLVECEVTTGWGEFIVDITVEVGLVPRMTGAPRTARAAARAGVVSDVP